MRSNALYVSISCVLTFVAPSAAVTEAPGIVKPKATPTQEQADSLVENNDAFKSIAQELLREFLLKGTRDVSSAQLARWHTLMGHTAEIVEEEGMWDYSDLLAHNEELIEMITCLEVLKSVQELSVSPLNVEDDVLVPSAPHAYDSQALDAHRDSSISCEVELLSLLSDDLDCHVSHSVAVNLESYS